MGATSVTGKGRGAASGLKGPGNNRNYFVPQVNPHVVAAGTITLSSGAGEVTFPNALPLSEDKYVVMLTAEATTNTYVSAKNDNSDDQFASFEIAGGTTDDVMWAVIKKGWGLEV